MGRLVYVREVRPHYIFSIEQRADDSIRIVRLNPDLPAHLQEVAADTKAAQDVADLVVDLAVVWAVVPVVAAVKSMSPTFVTSVHAP